MARPVLRWHLLSVRLGYARAVGDGVTARFTVTLVGVVLSAARLAVIFVGGTVEDPRLGAHDAFLDEIVDVADGVSCFPAAATTGSSGTVVEALLP